MVFHKFYDNFGFYGFVIIGCQLTVFVYLLLVVGVMKMTFCFFPKQ